MIKKAANSSLVSIMYSAKMTHKIIGAFPNLFIPKLTIPREIHICNRKHNLFFVKICGEYWGPPSDYRQLVGKIASYRL